MNKRFLRDIEVSSVGYGCMGLSHGYGALPERKQAISLIQHALDQGCTHFDTAEVYGNGHNETLVGEALHPVRDKVVIASKLYIDESRTDMSLEEQIRQHLDASLERLNTDYIDIYYQHRVSQTVAVEEVAACMGNLIQEGKIRGWGQSQATADQIKRAHAVTPLTAIQSEYSLMERVFEEEVLPLCQALNIGFVAFSPLASGFLSGKAQPQSQHAGDDVRRVITRFSDENTARNQPLIDLIQTLAERKAATPAQISLAWMLCKWPFVTPIPGGRRVERINENMAADKVIFSPSEFKEFENKLSQIKIYGNRTDEDIAKLKDNA